jgi:hypothetical protein
MCAAVTVLNSAYSPVRPPYFFELVSLVSLSFCLPKHHAMKMMCLKSVLTDHYIATQQHCSWNGIVEGFTSLTAMVTVFFAKCTSNEHTMGSSYPQSYVYSPKDVACNWGYTTNFGSYRSYIIKFYPLCQSHCTKDWSTKEVGKFVSCAPLDATKLA